MEFLDELIQNKALLYSIISVLFALILFVIYLILRENKEDKKEIEEILFSRVEPKRKIEEDEEVLKEENTMSDVFEEKKDNGDTLDIESMLEKMQEDLNAKAEDAVEAFEQEQEENSIISYQELIEKIKDKSKKEEVKEEKKPINEQMSLNLKDDKKFKKTDFISPIYGKMDEHLEYPTVPSFSKNDDEISRELEDYDIVSTNEDYINDYGFDSKAEADSLEQTLNMKNLSDDIKKNDEFLKALKEFRKNLD